jgi:hypothetical protein
MPVTCFPRFQSVLAESPEDPSWDIDYCAFGSESEAAIIAALFPILSPNSLGLWLGKYTLDHKGGGFWDIHVHYQRNRPIGAGYIVFAAEAQGKTIHKETSIVTTNSYGLAGQTPPDMKGLIGVDPIQRTVAGVDVVTPSFAFTCSVKMPTGTLPASYLDQAWRLVGTLNLLPLTLQWKGQIINFNQGEALFLGFNAADGGQDQTFGELIELNMKFDTSLNRLDLNVGGIEGVDKNGWDYLWTLRQATPVGTGGPSAALAMTAQAVYVEQVYEYDDWTALGIFSLTG